jgi:hypothetical protein
VSDDGSLNIWSLADRERLVQFEVKAAALCQALVYCNDTLFQTVTRYVRTSSKLATPLIMVGYADGSARLYDIDKKNIIYKIRPLNHSVTAINHCKNCKFLKLKGPKTTFFKNVIHSLIWLSFVELGKLILKIYAGLVQKMLDWGVMTGQSTSTREKKSVDEKNIFKILKLILGRFSFSFF